MANGDGPKRTESDVYDRQIRLWGAEAQVSEGKLKRKKLSFALLDA
jgi:hypothetical protein